MNIYADIILDHWKHPNNYGELSDYDLEAYEYNPLCGDEIKIQLKLTESNNKLKAKIEDIRFLGNGCAISQAAASILTEETKGEDTSKIIRMNEKEVINLIGISPGPARIKCATLALVTLKKAIKVGK